MNFDDTPQEAEFRATARKWVEANAPKKYETELSKSSLGRSEFFPTHPRRMSARYPKEIFTARHFDQLGNPIPGGH